MSPSGLEATPPRGFPYLHCPNCGWAIPRVAFPAVAAAAQEPAPADRAIELEDATPTMGQPVDRRLAPTDRILRPESRPEP